MMQLHKKLNISACLIIRDEEKNIYKCLNSIKEVCSEIILVDTGSIDNTISEIERFKKDTKANVKLYFKEWNNHFAEMRNYSLSKATGDYILVMDGDEVLQQWQEITDEYDYYVVNRKCGNEIFQSIALFKNCSEIKYEYQCHATVDNSIKGMKGAYSKVVVLTDAISGEELDAKVNRYIKMHLKQLETEPDNKTLYYYLARCYYYKKEWDKVIEYGLIVPNLDINQGMKAFVCNMLYNAFLQKGMHEPNFLSMSICFLKEQTAARIPLAMFVADKGNKEMALAQIDIAEYFQDKSKLPMDFQFSKQQFQNFRKQIVGDK